MKYHSLLTANNGLNTPSTNPCKLLEFGFLKLAAGETYSAESGEREVLAVLLGGKASFQIGAKRFEKVGGRPNVFSGKPHSVYIPAKSKFTITADTAVEIALPSAPSDLDVEPYVIEPSKAATGAWGAANFKRNFHQILTLAWQPTTPPPYAPTQIAPRRFSTASPPRAGAHPTTSKARSYSSPPPHPITCTAQSSPWMAAG